MRAFAFAALVLAGVALAGNAVKEVAVGAAPVTSQDGVTLGNAIGCRCSIHVDAGTGNVNRKGLAASGWYIYPWYYDLATGWTEASSSLRCQPNARLDGGLIFSFACPDMEPLARFGRLACSSFGPTGYDGGTGADSLSDAGTGPQPVVRTECWGPQVVP